MDVNNLLVYEGPVALLGILLSSIPEETAADGLLDPHRGFAARHHIQFMSGGGERRSINSQSLNLAFYHLTVKVNGTCP